MKDFTKITQQASVLDNSKDRAIAVLNRVAREWQQGQSLIVWEVIPPVNAKSVENMVIIVKILILMSVFYTVFFTFAPLVQLLFYNTFDKMAMIGVFAILSVVLQLFVALPLLLKYLRSNRWRAIKITIDRTAKTATIRRSSNNIQMAAFGTPNVLLPAFRLPENNAVQYTHKKEALQSRISAETGFLFEEWAEIQAA